MCTPNTNHWVCMHSRRSIFDFGECVKTSECISDSTNGIFSFSIEQTHIHPNWTKHTHCNANRPPKTEQKMNCRTKHGASHEQKQKTHTKTKALKIEMEIKRSEMCKILLFFLHFISFTSLSLCVVLHRRLFGHRNRGKKTNSREMRGKNNRRQQRPNEPTTFTFSI